MKIPDEMLSAFVNGELDGPERHRVELAMARDRTVAQRVAKQRADRSRLHDTLDEVLRPAPRPKREISSYPHPGTAQIIDLARVRATRKQTERRRRPQLGPRALIVASLTMGAALGALLGCLNAGDTLTQYQDGRLLARGALARALNEQIAGHAPAGATIRVSATYRTHDGAYCRTFTVPGSPALAGLACRNQARWQVQTLLTNGSAPALLELNRNIGSTPVAVEVETQLRARDWH